MSAGYFTLPLPPTANHQYTPILRRAKDGRMVHGKRWSDEYEAWRQEVALIVRDWEPGPHEPLAVSIDLYIPSKLGRNCDIDGFIKPILDAVIGKGRDQWVDYLRIRRHVADGEGYGEVIVGADRLPEPDSLVLQKLLSLVMPIERALRGE